MNENIMLTEQEKKELKQAMKNGGVFLKLFENLDISVEVQATDANNGWRTIQIFDKKISSKIKALYDNQKTYKAHLEGGFRQVSLSWFIAAFC